MLGTPVGDACVVAYALADYDVEPAVKLLQLEGDRHEWPTRTAAELGALVEEVFCNMHTADPAGLVALIDSPSGDAVMRRAVGLVEEWRLYRWGLEQNVAKGVAPPSRAMLEELARDRHRRGHAAPHGRGTTAVASSRQYMTRFRRRWGGHFGALSECYDSPQDEMVEKAFLTAHLMCGLLMRCLAFMEIWGDLWMLM